MFSRYALSFSSLLGASAVFGGAYASHALSGAAQLTMQTAIQYLFIHCIVCIAVSLYRLHQRDNIVKNKLVNTKKYWLCDLALLFWILGMFLFSLNLAANTLLEAWPLSFLTPVGGICYAFGWLSLATHGIFLRIE
ncbi:MAG: DUF423 domain-containing protein [Alphaproteobacteria bacterium]|nr:DUF423 domain-containing protein [Alphaproteobacteria bacterium]